MNYELIADLANVEIQAKTLREKLMAANQNNTLRKIFYDHKIFAN